MRKSQDIYREQKYVEIKNVYALTVDGTIASLKLILSHLIQNLNNQT
jgi:hypothetical protein